MTPSLFEQPQVEAAPFRYELREYQRKAVETALSHKNGILVLPTGSGKSLVCAGIVSATKGKAVVLQPTKEILESNYEKIQAFGFEGATIFSASCGIKEIGKATYATIGSIRKRPDLFTPLDLLIVDEAHLVNAKGGMYEQFIYDTRPKRLIGMTATPYRLHTTSSGSNLRLLSRTRPKIFERIIHVTQTQVLAEEGFLHRPEFTISGKDKGRILQPNTTGAEYSDRSIQTYLKTTSIDERIIEAIQAAVAEGKRHILLFVPRLADSEAAVKTLKEMGIEADSVDGKTPKKEREYRLRKFRTGMIRVMANVGVLTTGYDFPELDCIVSARPTMSLGLYYQIIGRCVRPHPEKGSVIVYDLVDNFSRFGDPMDMVIAETSAGLHDVYSAQGRLTGRYIEDGHEKNSRVQFGKFKNKAIKNVPIDYLRWYVDNSGKSPNWHHCMAEINRRMFFGAEDA